MRDQEQQHWHLAQAEQRIVQTKEHIGRQQKMIERLAQNGPSTTTAEGLLEPRGLSRDQSAGFRARQHALRLEIAAYLGASAKCATAS